MDTSRLAGLFDELEKISTSRLRSAVEVVRAGPKMFQLVLKNSGEAIGHMRMQGRHGDKVWKSAIKPKYKGMGLGKKMYGEVMRRMPKQHLKSDNTVSHDAIRVWKGMKKRKGYKVWENPGSTETREGLQTGVLKGGVRNPEMGRTRGGAAFSAKLPAKAEIKDAW